MPQILHNLFIMKWLLLIILLFPLAVISCDNTQSVNSFSSGTSIAKVTNMYTERRMIGGPRLAIELEPGKKAEAGKYYAVDVSYLKKGRYRTAVGWTELEIALAKPKNVYIPLSENEERTLYMETESKLREVFGVTIEPSPMDVNTLNDMLKKGIITIYQ